MAGSQACRYLLFDLGKIILFLCVMFWGQTDAKDSLQWVNVMLVKSFMVFASRELRRTFNCSLHAKAVFKISMLLLFLSFKSSRHRLVRGVKKKLAASIYLPPDLFGEGCVV